MARMTKQPRRRWWAVAARPVTGGLPLDIVSVPAAAAYSYRKLRAAYAGPAANVQRSSDQTFSDVGFAGNDFNAAAFSAFIGGGTGATQKWYDQTGNANTMTSAFILPNANQAVLQNDGGAVYTGAVAKVNTSTVLQAPDAASIQNIWATGGFVVLVFNQQTALGGAGDPGPLIAKGTTAGWLVFLYNTPPQQLLHYVNGTAAGNTYISNTIPLLARHVMTFAWNATTPATPATITLDGVVCGLTSSATPTGTFASDAGQPLQLYNDNVIDVNNHAFGGYLYEVLVYKGIPSAAEQGALVGNLKGYYGIP